MTISFEKLKARLLANPKVKAEYDALAPEFEISAELLKARLRAGLSQSELAARMGTSQSTIARLENGQTLPSTKTLLRYAQATTTSSTCGCRLLDAVFANGRQRYHTKPYSGAPVRIKLRTPMLLRSRYNFRGALQWPDAGSRSWSCLRSRTASR